jgi:hypothetical protein
VPVCSDSFIDQLRGRLAFNSQHFPAQSGGPKPCFCFLPVLTMLEVTGTRNKKDSFAMAGQKVGELCSHAMTKNNPGQAGKRKSLNHGLKIP